MQCSWLSPKSSGVPNIIVSYELGIMRVTINFVRARHSFCLFYYSEWHGLGLGRHSFDALLLTCARFGVIYVLQDQPARYSLTNIPTIVVLLWLACRHG